MKQSIKRMFMATAGVLSIGTMGLFAQNKNDTGIKLSEELKNTNGYQIEVTKKPQFMIIPGTDSKKSFIFIKYKNNIDDMHNIKDTLTLVGQDFDSDGMISKDEIRYVEHTGDIGDGERRYVRAEYTKNKKFEVTSESLKREPGPFELFRQVGKAEITTADKLEDIGSLGIVLPAFKNNN